MPAVMNQKVPEVTDSYLSLLVMLKSPSEYLSQALIKGPYFPLFGESQFWKLFPIISLFVRIQMTCMTTPSDVVPDL